MRENVDKMASCASFFNMHTFTYNRNQFFEVYIIYLYVNRITKSEDDYLNINKITVYKVQRWYEGKARLWDLRADLQPLAWLLFKFRFRLI